MPKADMAIIRLGPIASGISGALGGVVFVNTKRSTVVRPRPAPRHKSSPFLARSKARMQSLRNFWSTLTALQQDAWRTAAADINRTNALGQSSPLSGFGYFIMTNKTAFPGFFETFPFPANLLPQDVAVNPAASFSAAAAYTVQIDNPVALTFLRLYAYGWPFWRDTPSRDVARLVFIRETTSDSDPVTMDIKTEWLQHFGPLQEGQRYAVGIKSQFSHSPFVHMTVLRQTVSA